MENSSHEKTKPVMTRAQVRAFDAHAINNLNIPGVVLMENAGRSCAEIIKQKLSGIEKPKVRIFCGTGNNGGDGYVIARHLLNYHIDVGLIICPDQAKVKGDARINLDILKTIGQRIDQLDPASPDIARKINALTADADIIVDAIFGTGLKGQLSDNYKKLIDSINDLDARILAVDIPSGLDCDTGLTLGTAIKADWTVTFVAKKVGFNKKEAAHYLGRLYVVSIGINPT